MMHIHSSSVDVHYHNIWDSNSFCNFFSKIINFGCTCRVDKFLSFFCHIVHMDLNFVIFWWIFFYIGFESQTCGNVHLLMNYAYVLFYFFWKTGKNDFQEVFTILPEKWYILLNRFIKTRSVCGPYTCLIVSSQSVNSQIIDPQTCSPMSSWSINSQIVCLHHQNCSVKSW